VTEPRSDPQHEAFAGAGESDWARAAELLDDAVVHEPDDPDAEPIRTPEDWDAEEWDSQRQPPKTLDEANGALAGRLATPEAPDVEVVDYETVELTPDQGGPAPEKGGPE
jgi:hypothetical protein